MDRSLPLSPSSRDPVVALVGNHPALAGAVLITSTFTLKVWLVAAADPVVALGIVAASGGLQLAASLLALFLPAVIWSLVVWLVYLMTRPRPPGARRLYLYIGTWVAAAWAVMISPLAWLPVVVIGVVVIPGFFRVVEWLLAAFDGSDPDREPFVNLIPIGGAFAWSIFLFLPTMWLPPENYTLGTGDIEVGYFIESDGRWVTVLREQDRHLIRVHAESIQSREVCSFVGPRNLVNTPVYQFLYRADALPRCHVPTSVEEEQG